MGMIIGRSRALLKCSRNCGQFAHWVRDENSLPKMQNVRGDSSAVPTATARVGHTRLFRSADSRDRGSRAARESTIRIKQNVVIKSPLSLHIAQPERIAGDGVEPSKVGEGGIQVREVHIVELCGWSAGCE